MPKSEWDELGRISMPSDVERVTAFLQAVQLGTGSAELQLRYHRGALVVEQRRLTLLEGES